MNPTTTSSTSTRARPGGENGPVRPKVPAPGRWSPATTAGVLVLTVLHLTAGAALLTSVVGDSGPAVSGLTGRHSVRLGTVVAVAAEAFAVTLTGALAPGRLPRWWLWGPVVLIALAVAVQFARTPLAPAGQAG
ncbi:hypothetical protein ACFVIM_31855 [Streptomyces sp. NPDC057638]|uniref:hypothetical protein n=1 Tax=Streptomyces sp. NPDC057638 TaxID=3346190 RepID=UPI0036AB1793